MILESECLIKTRNNTPDDAYYCVFVLDNEVVEIGALSNYFYNLLVSNFEIVENINAPEEKSWVDFINNDGVIDTLECSPKLSAILRSNPKLFVIFNGKGPEPSERHTIGWKRYIDIGWTVDDQGFFNLPDSWSGGVIEDLPQRIENVR